MRILHIIPSLSGGGAERQLSYLAVELVHLGHDVHIAYSMDGPYKPELPNVILHQFKQRSNYDPLILWQLLQIIRSTKPDIINTWILQMDILGGIAARISKIPWIFREPSSEMAYKPSWKHRLRIKVAAGASAIVSNSIGGDQYWRTQLPNSHWYIIANGIPSHEIDKTFNDIPFEFQKSEVPIVLYAGRLIDLKNLKVFLRELAYVKKQQKVIGVLCGEGPQRHELEELRHKLGLDMDVHFMGHLPGASVWALMKKATVFVSLSEYEGCPNTVMEAIACGCPVVVSDIPAHREILDESSALLVEPSDQKETANAILTAIRNEKVSKLRALNAKKIIQKWSIPEMAIKFENIYSDLLNYHKK